MSLFPAGKLPNALLERLLERRPPHDPRVLVGPRVGEDAAVLDFGDRVLVIATDPITFAADKAGWYAVQVNANDVAVRGARPRWFLAVLLLPEVRTDQALVSGLFEEIRAACVDLDCELIGGHTEITIGLDRPIVIGQMLGEVEKERLVTTGGARAGDTLLLTGEIAIEGTALLARERADLLRARGVTPESLEAAQGLVFSPGISVVRAALVASDAVRVHAMHDPTEGGLATGVAELAAASGLGVRVMREQIPILPECEAICRVLGIDPLGLLASGALLLAVAPEEQARVTDALAREGIACRAIGELRPRGEGLTMETRDGVVPLPAFLRDEVAQVQSAARH